MFVEKSKRKVSRSEAKLIINAVRSRSIDETAPAHSLNTTDWFTLQTSRLAIAAASRRPLFVGVFQNPTLDELLATVDELKLDVVQLHGDEPVGWSRLIGVPVIKVFHVDSKTETAGGEVEAALKDASRPGFHAVPLLDTKVSSEKGALSGGAGKAFDWQVAKRLVESREEGQGRLPIILAGGLDSDNVGAALKQVHPWAVDVSGGVETNGIKDIEKIISFINEVKK